MDSMITPSFNFLNFTWFLMTADFNLYSFLYKLNNKISRCKTKVFPLCAILKKNKNPKSLCLGWGI